MYPTATSNTNHMAVFDFKGETYFVYHNGSLPGGNGYRRSACITKLHFNDDGSIDLFDETAAGLGGECVELTLADGTRLEHEAFVNSTADADYPLRHVALGSGIGKFETDGQWVLVPGKADRTNDAYVSIQSENKPGLYVTVKKDGGIELSQDISGSDAFAQAQTFRSVTGLADAEGVSFESVRLPGLYLTLDQGALVLSDGTQAQNATFYVSSN